MQSGETTLLKFVTIYNRHATLPATMSVCRGLAAADTNNATFIRETLQPREVLRIDLWTVHAAGTTISAIASINGAISVNLYGAELEGVAD